MYSIALCQVVFQPSVRLATMTSAAARAAMRAMIQNKGEAANFRAMPHNVVAILATVMAPV